MKRIVFTLCLLFALCLIHAQDTIKVRKTEPAVYSVVDQQAEFEGGYVAMANFINANINFPEACRRDSLLKSCKVYLKFVVSETGSISNVQVLRGCAECRDCDQEAIRVVNKMPLWQPAKVKGRPVKAFYHLPINFKMK